MDLSKHMLFQSVRLVGAVGIEFSVNRISPADSVALVCPDSPKMQLRDRVLWPRCGHIARARDRPLRLAKEVVPGRRDELATFGL
jgi:hypothetical protein